MKVRLREAAVAVALVAAMITTGDGSPASAVGGGLDRPAHRDGDAANTVARAVVDPRVAAGVRAPGGVDAFVSYD